MFSKWIKYYNHKLLVLNVKEEGLENQIINILKKNKVKNFFFHDQTFSTILKTMNKTNVSVRFSEYEPIENVVVFKNKFNWIWVDSITKVPITDENFQTINKFNVCVVCPSLWKRSEDINKEKYKLSKYNFDNLKIITKHKYIDMWLDSFN